MGSKIITIKAFVINLPHRQDRYEKFLESYNKIKSGVTVLELNLFEAINGNEYDYKRILAEGMDTYRSWRDPFLNRKLTRGEIGCLLSHINLWQKCVNLNEPIIIFEDDIEFLENFDSDKVALAVDKAELVYLARRDIGGRSVQVDADLAIPSYSYWTSAYAITPSGAEKLCNEVLQNNLAVVDEYLPVMYGDHPNEKFRDCFKNADKLKALAFEPNICQPSGSSSDIENNGSPFYLIDFDTHVFTVATDVSKAKKLIHSCERNEIEFFALGANGDWTGGDMAAGPGGGMKVNLLKSIITTIDDNDVVMFVDGYDVFVNDRLDTIINRYLEFRAKVVFAAEKICWPDEWLSTAFPEPEEGYRYLNSGCFIGVASEIKRILEEPIKDSDDDQFYYQTRYLSRRYDMVLDTKGYIFQCISGAPIGINECGQLTNFETDCTGCILHGNGGVEDKQRFDDLYHQLFAPKKNKIIGLRKKE